MNQFKQFITNLKKTGQHINRAKDPLSLYLQLFFDFVGIAGVVLCVRTNQPFFWLVGAIIALEMLGDLAYHRIHFEINQNNTDHEL